MRNIRRPTFRIIFFMDEASFEEANLGEKRLSPKEIKYFG
jgi:hypothetical protein